MDSLDNLKSGGRSTLNDTLTIILLFVLWRGLLFAFNFAGGAMMNEHYPNYDKDYQAFHDNRFWDGWARWDSGWYMRIAERGYYIEGRQSNVAFFPLFPYAAKAVGKVVGSHWAGGLVVSNLSLLFSLFFLLGIARRYLDPDGSRRFLIYLLIFPSSFFFSAYYTEGLFLLTTSASFYFYLSEKFLLCGVFGSLAAMTRSTGVALFVAYLIGYLWKKRFSIAQMSPAFLWILLIPCGVGVFMWILWKDVGDPLAFMKYQSAWGRGFVFPLTTYINAFREINWSFPLDPPYFPNMHNLLNLISSVFFLILPFFLFGKCDAALPVYSLLLVLIPLSSGSMLSMVRFEVVAFPTFLVLARMGENRSVDRFLVSLFAIFLGLYSILFAKWFWAG